MPYDESLAQDLRALLCERDDVTEQKMFGGLAFLVAGNLAVCAGHAGELMVRVGPDAHDAARAREGTSDFVMSGRVARAWVLVDPATITTDDALRDWVAQGVAFASTLEPK